jgi:hypothetical protein
MNTKKNTFFTNIRMLIALTIMTWAWLRIFPTKSTPNHKIQSTKTHSKYPSPTIRETLDKPLKLGVVKRSNSIYTSPIFCIPKIQGQGLRIIKDFRELNQNSHIDKYSVSIYR